MYFTVPFLRPFLNDNSETNSSVNTLLSCVSSARFIITSRHFFFVRSTHHHAFFLHFWNKNFFRHPEQPKKPIVAVRPATAN